MDKLGELTKKYVEIDRKYKEYRDQFISCSWEGEGKVPPQKSLTKEEIRKIQKMKEEVDDAYNKWITALNEN